MKESLQEQLARLAKSGGLQVSTSNTAVSIETRPVVSLQAQKNQASAKSYEDLILQIEVLREHNKMLLAENATLRSNPEAELIQSQIQLKEALARTNLAEISNGVLIGENLRLKREFENLPDKEVIARWREKAIQADAHIIDANKLIDQLETEKSQLAADRKAFEADLIRLDELDDALKELTADRQRLMESEEIIRKQNVAAESTLHKLLDEQARLEKQSTDLAALQARIGHLKGIEKKLNALEDEYARLEKLYESGKTRIRNLTAYKNEAIKKLSDAAACQTRVTKDLNHALAQLEAVPDGEVVMRSFETVEWLVSQFEDPYERVLPKQVLLIGDGPWPIKKLTELLQELGFEVWQNGCNADIEVVVVGRANWSESDIDAQIDERDGESLRVYPQELFVLMLAMQADPLEIADPEALLKFVDEHPVFEYLFNQDFPWPETSFEDGPPATIGEGFDGEDASSPLYKLGYSVAQQVALSPSQRHAYLEETYSEVSLPWCISDAYMNDWGDAKSRTRLRRIAWHLHLMTKRFRRHAEAVARWESDLDWLKRNYYKPIHRFRWPN